MKSRRAPARISRDLPQWNRKPNERLRPKHLDFIRSLPCAACGKASPSEPAHVRITSADHPGSGGGTQYKPPDRFTVPLCTTCHRRQHGSPGEVAFWSQLGVDPLDLSLRLWTVTGDQDAGERAVMRFLQNIELHRAKPEGKT